MTPAIIRPPSSTVEWDAYFDLRYRILRQPWNQPPGSEKDPGDASGYHAIAFFEPAIPVAAGCFHTLNQHTVRIRYMCVDENYQGSGIGKQVLLYLENWARQLKFQKSVLQARNHVTTFYEKLGYISVGTGPTLFNSIPHTHMEKDL